MEDANIAAIEAAPLILAILALATPVALVVNCKACKAGTLANAEGSPANAAAMVSFFLAAILATAASVSAFIPATVAVVLTATWAASDNLEAKNIAFCTFSLSPAKELAISNVLLIAAILASCKAASSSANAFCDSNNSASNAFCASRVAALISACLVVFSVCAKSSASLYLCLISAKSANNCSSACFINSALPLALATLSSNNCCACSSSNS